MIAFTASSFHSVEIVIARRVLRNYHALPFAKAGDANARNAWRQFALTAASHTVR